MRNEKLLERLTQLWGVAGYESEVREAIEAEGVAFDQWLEAYEGFLGLACADAPEEIEARMALAIRGRVLDICGEAE